MMTRLVFMADLLTPVLILSPVKTEFSRTITIFFFLSMHLGIALLMKIGVFPYLSIAIWLLFLPTGFWRWIKKEPSFVIEEPQCRWTGMRDSLLCLTLVYVFITNIAQWEGVTTYTSLRKIGHIIELDQQWITFNNPCKF